MGYCWCDTSLCYMLLVLEISGVEVACGVLNLMATKASVLYRSSSPLWIPLTPLTTAASCCNEFPSLAAAF